MPPSPSPPPDWTSTEPGLRAALVVVARTLQKALHRPITVISFAVSIALAAVSGSVTAKRTTAVVTLKVSESDVERSHVTPRNLRAHLMKAALSSTRLAAIVRANELYPRVAATDMASAVAALREDMTLEVSQNGLYAERGPDEPARSARVALGYTASTATLATAVAQSLADAVIAGEAELRAADAAAATLAVGGGLDALRERYLSTVAARSASQRADGDPARPSRRTSQLKREERDLSLRLTETETQRTSLELLTRAEQTGLGTRVDRVYERVSSRGGATRGSLTILGAVLFALVLPLCALVVGAFDGRIRDRGDLERSGVRLFGELPRRHRARGRTA